MAHFFEFSTTTSRPRTSFRERLDHIAVVNPDLLIIDLVLGEVAGWSYSTLASRSATLDIPVI